MSTVHKPKNILFVSAMNGAAWGGSEELWYQSAIWCARNNFKVSVCCFEWKEKEQRLKILAGSGCTLYLLPGKEQIKKRPFLARARTRKLLKSIPFSSFDLVIINQGGWKDLATFPFSFLFTRLKKYVILYHNYNPSETLSLTKTQLMQEWAIGAKINFGATLKIFQTMQDSFRIAVPNQKKLFNPVTIETPPGPVPYPSLHNGRYKFSVLAALDIERKAQDLLVEAFSDDRWKNRNWELHFYGEGKDKEHLRKLVKEKSLDGKIFVHGNARDYTAAISSSHLVLQLTRIDAMPVSVIEAMAMARPVVVSEVGDMPYWIKDHENGWVCKKLNKETILKTLEMAWDQKDTWEQMGLRAFEKFRNDFPKDPVTYFLEQCGVVETHSP